VCISQHVVQSLISVAHDMLFSQCVVVLLKQHEAERGCDWPIELSTVANKRSSHQAVGRVRCHSVLSCRAEQVTVLGSWHRVSLHVDCVAGHGTDRWLQRCISMVTA